MTIQVNEPEELSMVRITEWKGHKIEKSIYWIFLTIIAFGVLWQFISISNFTGELPVLRPVLLGVVIAIFASIFTGMIWGVKKKEGAMGLSFYLLMWLFVVVIFMWAIILTALFIVLVLVGGIYSSKRQSSLKIYTVGSTSVSFYKVLIDMITRILKENRIGYTRNHNVYHLKAAKGEKIKVVIQMMDGKQIGHYYDITLVTRASDAKVEKIKKIIHEAVVDLNNKRNIDSYPQERFYCKYCGKEIFYDQSLDWFYCHKCHRPRRGNNVRLVVTKP